eukprot:15005422-Heterocapsa_arctica.AAC.1
MEMDALDRGYVWRTYDNEKPSSGEQHHRARQFRDTDHRYGDENQSGRVTARIFRGMLPAQDSSMPQWKAELDHLRQQRVLQIQFLTESCGELRD